MGTRRHTTNNANNTPGHTGTHREHRTTPGHAGATPGDATEADMPDTRRGNGAEEATGRRNYAKDLSQLEKEKERFDQQIKDVQEEMNSKVAGERWPLPQKSPLESTAKDHSAEQP